ncbi:MAG: shikimate dehydrogenase [Sumerlaeia bacterium]
MTVNGIGGKTRLAGVMGWPVSHTKSPAMQGAALAAAGLDVAYVPLPVAPERVAEAVRGLRALGFVGCNVTVPHKIAVMEALDRLDPLAEKVGAVNTIKVEEDGTLVGYNTDAQGAVTGLAEVAPASVFAREALIVGTGGAGRGVAFGALEAGARGVALLNRTAAKAQELADSLRAAYPDRSVRVLDPPAVKASDLAEIGAVYQTTSLGMKPESDPLPLDAALLPEGAAVLEAVYAPLETPFLAACRARGLIGQDGLAMLVGQGALSFHIWFGREADRDAMRRAIAG